MMMMLTTTILWLWWQSDIKFNLQVGSVGLKMYMNYVEKLRWKCVRYICWKIQLYYSTVVINCSYALDCDVPKFAFLTLLISLKLSVPCEGLRKFLWIQNIPTKVPLYVLSFYLCLFVCSLRHHILYPISWYSSAEHELNNNKFFGSLFRS